MATISSATLSRKVSTAAFLVALSHLALEFFQNFLPVVYPLLIESMGLTYAQIGIFALMGGIFGALAQPLFGYLSDRWRPRHIIVLSIIWSGTFMGVVGFAAHYVGQYWLLVVAVGLGSLGSAAFHPAGASLAGVGDPKRRGAALSIFSVGGNLGSALSPLVVGVGLVWFGVRGTAVIIPVAILISLFLYQKFRWLPLPNRETYPVRSGHQPKPAAKNGSWLAISLIVLIVGARSWFQGTLITYLPEWLQSQGRSLEGAGSILSILLVSVSIGSLTGGTISDRVGRVPVVVVSLGLLMPFHWLFLHTSGVAQVLSVGMMGVMIGATFPVVIVMAQEAWPQAVGLGSALVLGIGWLPAGLGSWVIGLIADQTSLTFALSTLMFVPVIGVLAVGLFTWRFR